MRFYKIVNKSTGLVLEGHTWHPETGRGKKKKPAGYHAVWNSHVMARFREIDSVNAIIGGIISRKLQAELDNCEIMTFEQKYVPINGAVKLKNTRARLEQEALVATLKGYK